MGLTARKVHYYEMQATCNKCGKKSSRLKPKTKTAGYETLRMLGWKLRTTRKEALCKDCQ